jgi:hypothetical protein
LYQALNIPVGQGAKASTIFVDIVLSSAIGAFLVMILASPHTVQQALAAGLGMSGLLSAFQKET